MKLKDLLKESQTLISQIYEEVENSGTVTEEIDMAESEYIGGVGDLGYPEAVQWVIFRDSYEPYKEALQKATKKYLGSQFTAYRLMIEDAYEDWKDGGDLGFLSVSLEKRIAEAFRKFPLFSNRDDLVLLSIQVPYHAVVMRGHEEEAELVIDSSDIEANRQVRKLDEI